MKGMPKPAAPEGVDAPEPAAAAGTPPRASGPSRFETLFAVGVLVLALLVRVLFLADKPFWRDEAWVALLVDDPLRAAAEGRAAPLGFLALTHVLSGVPALPPEISYRLLPLASGLVLVPLVAAMAIGLGASRRVALAAMALAAGLQPLVYYSRELKSYGLDALVATLLPLLASAAFADDRATRRVRAGFVAALVVAPWMSFGGVFAAAAVLAWGWLAWWPRGNPDRRRGWLLASLAFTASFAALYVLALGHQADDPWMHAYWNPVLRRDDRFVLPLRFVVAMLEYGRVAGTYLFRDLWPAALVLAVTGACAWPRPHRGFLVFQAVATAALCAAAVVTDRYLLVSGRLLLVAAPVPLLWIAAGLEALARRAGTWWRPSAVAGLPATLALGLPLALALGWSLQSVAHRVGPYRTNGANFFRYDVLHDVPRMIDAGAPLVAQGGPVLVSRRCTYPYRFYDRGRWKHVMVCPREDASCDRSSRHWIAKRPERGWILMTEEETGWFARELKAAGLVHRERALARGVRLWEIGQRKPRAAAGPPAPATRGDLHGSS